MNNQDQVGIKREQKDIQEGPILNTQAVSTHESWDEFHESVKEMGWRIGDLAEWLEYADSPSRWMVIAAIALLHADGYDLWEAMEAISGAKDWRTRTRAILDGWRPMALRWTEDGRVIDVDIDGRGTELSDEEFCGYQSLVKLQHGSMILSFSDGRSAEFVLPLRLQYPERTVMKGEEKR